MPVLGSKLLESCRSARSDVLFVAPFMKADIVSTLLQEIPLSVPKITFVTRWIVSEILAGVSDLEVYDHVKARGGTLLLHPSLHAKYYRIDAKCMVGSANLTRKALGFSATPNLELLFYENTELPEFIELEKKLHIQAITVTDILRLKLAEEIERIAQDENQDAAPNLIASSAAEIERGWLPTCVLPENLYKVYTEKDTSDLLESTIKSAEYDLKACKVIPGLEIDQFELFLRTQLESNPIIDKIGELTKYGITQEKAVEILSQEMSSLPKTDLSADDYWEVLKEWLLYFYPKRFRIRAAVEVLEQSREL